MKKYYFLLLCIIVVLLFFFFFVGRGKTMGSLVLKSMSFAHNGMDERA